MSDVRADAFRATMAQGEIRLQFGAERGNAGEVALERSVALPPGTALRLLARLREALRDAERRAAIAPGDVVAQMGTTLLNAAPGAAAEPAARLFERVDRLGLPYRHERSFRLTRGRLQANRVLLSLDRAQLGDAAAARALEVCDALGLPADRRAAAAALAASARSVHFGFEGDGDRALYKVYFERAAAAEEARAAPPGTRVLLHVAYKWEIAVPARCVTTRYEWLPGLDEAGLRARIAAAMGDGAALDALLDLLALAAPRARGEPLQLLEVAEEGSPRRSFDLNLYDAGLAVRDALGPLGRLREHFGVRAGQWQALADQIRALPLGHVAGGLHRDGEAFATVYYGVQSRG